MTDRIRVDISPAYSPEMFYFVAGNVTATLDAIAQGRHSRGARPRSLRRLEWGVRHDRGRRGTGTGLLTPNPCPA